MRCERNPSKQASLRWRLLTSCCHPPPAAVLDLQTYGPGGANPLLPGPQPPSSQITLGIDAAESAAQADQSYVALAVRSPADLAVDVSNWKVTAGSTTWAFPPGRVAHELVNLPACDTGLTAGFTAVALLLML
jgi:hypothetical protein